MRKLPVASGRRIQTARAAIDRIDDALVRSLVRRRQLVSKIQKIKKETGIPACDPVREKKILRRLGAKHDPGMRRVLRRLYETIFSWSGEACGRGRRNRTASR